MKLQPETPILWVALAVWVSAMLYFGITGSVERKRMERSCAAAAPSAVLVEGRCMVEVKP